MFLHIHAKEYVQLYCMQLSLKKHIGIYSLCKPWHANGLNSLSLCINHLLLLLLSFSNMLFSEFLINHLSFKPLLFSWDWDKAKNKRKTSLATKSEWMFQASMRENSVTARHYIRRRLHDWALQNTNSYLPHAKSSAGMSFMRMGEVLWEAACHITCCMWSFGSV